VLVLVLSFSCRQKHSEQINNKQTFRFVSEEHSLDYIGRLSQDSLIISKNNTEVLYKLGRGRSGSGSKYANNEGIAIWIKGEEFMYLLNDSLIATGKILK
jgi:membrane-bound inhibitor of C-type lysozyme